MLTQYHHAIDPEALRRARWIANKYGVMKEKNMYGKKVMGVARTTFVIENGKIAKVFNNVKPEGHAEEVLEYLKGVMKGAA